MHVKLNLVNISVTFATSMMSTLVVSISIVLNVICAGGVQKEISFIAICVNAASQYNKWETIFAPKASLRGLVQYVRKACMILRIFK